MALFYKLRLLHAQNPVQTTILATAFSVFRLVSSIRSVTNFIGVLMGSPLVALALISWYRQAVDQLFNVRFILFHTYFVNMKRLQRSKINPLHREDQYGTLNNS